MSLSDWRSGGSMDRLSQRSSLYSAPSYKKGTSSASGGYIQEEIIEMTRWANQYLNVGDFSDHLITDLTSDLSDGITLIRLVQSVAGEPLPRHSLNPMMKVQKIENFKVVLDYLKEAGIQLAVHPEDLAGGSVKAMLVVCKALRRHYTAGPSSPTSRSRGQRSFRYSSLDKEDMAVLSWVGEVLHRTITDYTVLYDGHVLCELVNTVQVDTVQDQDSLSAEQRLTQVLSASEHHFYIPSSTIDVSKVSSGSQDSLLRAFLQQIKTVHVQRSRRQPPSSTRSTRPRAHSRDEVFSSLQRGGSKSREQREEAKIAARTYEGLKARKTGSYSDLTDGAPLSSTLTKHSSTEALQKAPMFGPLDRHHSVDAGIAPVTKRPPTSSLLRSTSQTIPAHRRSLLDINMSTFDSRGLGRHTPSYTRLDNGSVDELTSLVTALEERVATLTAQFLFERHDMFKRMDRALVKERKRRQTVEKRLREVEGLVSTLVKHYDARLIDMAKQVSQLRGELMISQDRPTTVTMEIEQLKEKVQALSSPTRTSLQTQITDSPTKQTQSSRHRSHTLFVRKKSEGESLAPKPSPQRKRSSSYASKPPFSKPEKVFYRGPVTGFRKLSNFFGVEPPRLEDITTFLDGLGYSDLIQLFTGNDVTLAELSVMSDKDLERLGVPLGPRIRILQEIKSLRPLDEGTVI